ncbi:MAG TPA: zf-HC2 domain-containing protein [Polyangia bacterium]
MSETTTNTSGACELVLDYVYGELDEGKKRLFEEHLPTCARCQQEVASFGRVRAAVKRVMPSVEPSASLGGGALHAQLMHAAAQRKPRRGVLLAFPRKIMQHPALSAAAMFAIVGGAIAFNWSRSKMAMPEKSEPAASDTAAANSPKPTEVTTPEPAAEPTLGFKNKEQDQNEPLLDSKGAAADKSKLALQTATGDYTVQQPVAHHALATTGAPRKEAAPARMKSISVDGKFGGRKHDGLADLSKDEDDANGLAGADRGFAGGVVGGGGGRASTNANVKSSAPEEIGRTVAEKAPARDDEAEGSAKRRSYDAPPSATAPAAAAAPKPVTMSPAPTMPTQQQVGYRAQSGPSGGAVAVAKPSSARNYDGLRKQADEWAKTGRCDEAIKAYEELRKSSQYISPTERVHWVHCLSESGRQEEAEKRLDELKQEKRVTPAQLQDAEREVNDTHRRLPEPKKAAKKAPPADRAPASTEAQQSRERPNEAPPQAAPPDSTNTKVKPTQSY